MNNYDLDDLSTPGHIQIDKLPKNFQNLYTSDNVFNEDIHTIAEFAETVNEIRSDYLKKIQDETNKEILSNLSSDNMITKDNNKS